MPTENAPALELNLDGFTDVDTAFIKNDPQVDYIISGYQPKESKFFECWIKDNKLSATISFPIYDINYRWLQDLDGDGKSEIIRAQGFEDGIDYSISKLEDAQEVLLLVFNPVLRDQTRPGQFFWGYPWDVKNVVTDKAYQLLSSLGNPDERDDNYFVPAGQMQLPYILFEGTTTQPDMVVQGIQPFEHRTLATTLEEVTKEAPVIPTEKQTDSSDLFTSSDRKPIEIPAQFRGTYSVYVETEATTTGMASITYRFKIGETNAFLETSTYHEPIR